jgi:hypothetical protein
MISVCKADFLQAVQLRAARVAVSPSATRGQGVGVTWVARKFLAELDLHKIAVKKAAMFRKRLDEETMHLLRALPATGRTWGLARKLLNIFLRDAFYTTYLQNYFELNVAEAFFEIPLDSITSKKLRGHAGRGVLPIWKGVKHVTPEASESYQLFAQQFAIKKGIVRVHLDTFWWGDRGVNQPSPRSAAAIATP